MSWVNSCILGFFCINPYLFFLGAFYEVNTRCTRSIIYALHCIRCSAMYSKGILQGIHKYISENHMKYTRSILECIP